jgi:hypothetical protein
MDAEDAPEPGGTKFLTVRQAAQQLMFDETLVISGGEFGRAPTSEGQKGRDHDHHGFTVWMAGAE